MSRKKLCRIAALILFVVVLLCGCAKQGSNIEINTLNDLNGKKVAVLTGTIFDRVAKETIPNCNIEYVNTNADLGVILSQNKVGAYLTDEPVARILTKKYSNQKIVDTLRYDEYGYIFKKDDERGKKLCNQMNEFLKQCKSDGTLSEIDEIWFGEDESRQVVDTDNLTAENGVLKFCVTSDVGVPFVYLKSGKYVGYDVDVAVRFCRKYGYGIEIADSSFAGLLTNVASGKSDFGASCITITDERKESVMFSECNYVGGIVAVANKNESDDAFNSISDLYGKRIAVYTGSVYEVLAKQYIKDCEVIYADSVADMAVMLEKGKADGYMIDEPIGKLVLKEYPNHKMIARCNPFDYGLIFPKNNQRSKELLDQMNAFIEKANDNGTLKKMDDIWLGVDEDAKVVDYNGLTGENGTITVSISSSIGEPFIYVKDGQYVGYDIDVVTRFCKEYGYKPEIIDATVPGLLANVSSGKCDFGACGITITEERKESMLFSEPYYKGASVVMVKDFSKERAHKVVPAFFNSIKTGFEKTFIRESRWKLFLSGIGTTLLVTVLATLLGTLLGFLIYVMCRNGRKVPNAIVNMIINLLEKTPVVVILMVLYYVVFGSIRISPVWVALVGFILIFASDVFKLIKGGVATVGKGQYEASVSLGYTDWQAFIRHIMPCALTHILPGYMTAIVALIKNTSIVGYIAVQDLTKVSDIIRSRTYEAFFPIIATAVIYILFAYVLTAVVRCIERKVKKGRREMKYILKGVVKHD